MKITLDMLVGLKSYMHMHRVSSVDVRDEYVCEFLKSLEDVEIKLTPYDPQERRRLPDETI